MSKPKATAKVSQEAVGSLVFHPDNPRMGNVPSIVESIETNGWFGTLIGQKSTRHILAGNHRLKAAIELGIATVPVIWLDVSDDRARRILLSDNRSADLAVYDDAALAALLKDVIGDGEADLGGTGWTEWDLNRLVESLEEEPPDAWKEYDTDLVDGDETDGDEHDGLKAVVCPKCQHRIEL